MRGLNRVTLIGILGRDPEMKYAGSGTSICTLSLATSEEWKDKQTGDKKEATEWHRIKIFGRLGEVCGEYLKKGSRIYIEGKLKTESWEKDGEKKYQTVIIADEMMMLDKPTGGRANSDGADGMRERAAAMHSERGGKNSLAGQARQAPPPDDDFEDSVPF